MRSPLSVRLVPSLGLTGLSRVTMDDIAVTQPEAMSLDERPDLARLMQWAAVMGPWLNVDVLPAVAEMPAEAVASLLDDAVHGSLLDRQPQAGRVGYQFTAENLRRELYAALPDAARAARHRRIAETLRDYYEERNVAGALAWHFERADDLAAALRYLRMAADHARAQYDNEAAIRHYTHALELMQAHPELAGPESIYAVLDGRERCYQRVGDRAAQRADLEALARQAEALEDVPRQIEVVTRQVLLANELGDHAEAVQGAETALALAKQIGDRKLEADSLTALGEASYRLGEQDRPQEAHTQALQLYRDLDDGAGEANSLRLLARVAYRAGRVAEVLEHYEEALALYRDLRDRSGEASILNALGVVAQDYAKARDYFEQSLSIAQAIGDRTAQGQAYNNLALIYWSLGLYDRARDYLEQAVQIERDLKGRSNLAYYLESLGRVYVDLGAYEQAEAVLEEGRDLAQETGARWVESAYWLGLGRVALARERPETARELIQVACDMQREIGALGDLAASLAWLGTAYLALGDWDAAYRATSEAVTQLKLSGSAGDYAPQDIWWTHYQVLQAAPSRFSSEAPEDRVWQCLQQAREAMFSSIGSLSDEGLRRNYLNKVQTNSDLLTEWTRVAAQRAPSPAATSEETVVSSREQDAVVAAQQLQDRMKRVLTVSQQMNEQHEAEALLDFVMDHVIELIGAERGAVVLVGEEGAMDVRATRGMEADALAHLQERAEFAVLDEVARSKMPVLVQDIDAGATPGDVDALDAEIADLNRRSVICVPLLARAELIGMIYVDNRSVSGRFSQADVDLLALFANQAATAIENTELYEETVAWARTLEQRVAERTAELREAYEALSRRATQLETSNQVGQQLTMLLDLDALLKRVVTLIQTQFDYYFVGIWLLDEKNDSPEALVLRAGVGRISDEQRAPGTRLSLQDGASPIVEAAVTGEEHRLADVCPLPADGVSVVLPETCAELVLPLRTGERTIGVLDIQSDREDAFDPDDRLVLQTLASQISISISNAQLYATELRRRHLAEALEQAGRELVRSLDMREVPGLILEQLADVVPYERCSIMLGRQDMLYIVAQRGFPQAERAKEVRVRIQEDDVFLKMDATRRPVVIDDVKEVPGWQFVEGLRVNRSWLGVPLITQDRVIGMISATRPEVAAFSQEDALMASAFAGQAAVALQNAQLYGELNQAYQTLERLDRTKSDFIEVTAHELRTPLTIIHGYAQMMRKHMADREDEEMQTVTEGIMAGTTRLSEIVGSILDVTKIDSQILRLDKGAVQIDDVVRRALVSFESALEERELSMTVEGLDALPPVDADPDLLYKVFYHLLVNAIKYTPDGGAITVQGHADPDAREVEVVISDTGIGIDEEHHELIFEKFYQTGEVAFHSSGRTKFKGGGPGLGLAIVKGIVTAHDGDIWVESPGYDEEACPGSDFHVRLPY